MKITNIIQRVVIYSVLFIFAGVAQASSLDLNSQERMIHRRAVEAIIWSMPLVNFQAMRDGLKKDAGIGFNDVAYHSKVQNWKLQTTTNNNTTPYVFIF